MIDKKMIENILKVPMLNEKLKTIDKLLQKQDYVQTYKAIAALIEIVCMILLEKVYHEKVQNSNIVILADLLEKHNEKQLKEILVTINGEYNFIKLNKVDEIDILSLLGNLDEIVRVILEKHDNIF